MTSLFTSKSKWKTNRVLKSNFRPKIYLLWTRRSMVSHSTISFKVKNSLPKQGWSIPLRQAAH